MTDPKALVHRTEFDAARRKTKTIANYVDGTPSGDTDQTIIYAYTAGLMTSMTADLPSPESDQVTTYTYGVSRGGSFPASKVASGRLLKTVAYSPCPG